MEHAAESYRSASSEHLRSAQWLHEEGRYCLAHYFSGLGEEFMLRAYLRRVIKEFDARNEYGALAVA